MSRVSALSLREVEQALRHADAQTRHQTLRAVADLFLSDAPRFDETRVAALDNVFDALMVDPQRSDLLDLSRRMAPVDNAPTRLIKRLAHDPDIAIAGPVLTLSPRLGADDLCNVARSRGNAHMLAMSVRKDLTEPVTDVLAAEGNEQVARAVADNHFARLSSHGIARLLEKSALDRSIAASLSSRPDISADVLNVAIARSAPRIPNDAVSIGAVMRLVQSLDQAKNLEDGQIAAFAAEGSYEYLVGALAVKTGLKYEAVERLMHPSRVSGIVLVCKALGLTWATVEPLLALCKVRNGLTDADVTRLRKEFLEVSRPIAARIVRFWQLRQSVGAA
jgi:uncharacterized protein (DUF2336 family)